MTGLKTRIETPSLRQSVAFYTDLLGLTVLETWDEEGDRGAILGLGRSPDGEAFLELAEADREGAPAGMSLQFRVADVHRFADGLRGRWAFEGPTQRPWGSTYLYLKDPAGVQVIVYEGER